MESGKLYYIVEPETVLLTLDVSVFSITHIYRDSITIVFNDFMLMLLIIEK